MPVLMMPRYNVNKVPNYNCDCCHKTFIPLVGTWNKYISGNQKTISCSKECGNTLKLRQVIVKCDNCGIKISRRKSHADRQQKNGEHQFCSVVCEMEYKHNTTYEFRKCEICGKEYKCPIISEQRFCSNKCQGKWQSTQIGILNPRSKRTWIPCTYCQKEIYYPNYKLKINNHYFCDEKCRQKWYAEIWSQQPQIKNASRERALLMLENGQFKQTNTLPQRIINDYLDSSHIDYITEYNTKYYAIDNYLTDSKLMIEIMGDYWHSNPLTFNDEFKLTKIQKERIIKDKAKHTYIKNQYSIEILYLWEKDIYKNLESCQKLIDLYIQNNGILNEYHSFNYHINSLGELELNDVRIIPYQEKTILQRIAI